MRPVGAGSPAPQFPGDVIVEMRGVRASRPRPPDGRRPVLDLPLFQVQRGERVAVLGPSGCGKTTLLHVVAGLLGVDTGSVRVAGCELSGLTEAARDRFRASAIGVVFQSFNLLPTLTAEENVLLPLRLCGHRDSARARHLLKRVGLTQEARAPSSHLSAGQQQRVAVARAVVHEPMLVVADEPTGNLDRASARAVTDLLLEVCEEAGASLLLVTHDRDLAARLDRTVMMADINRVGGSGAGENAS
ncbi:MAG: ABC transporter ATP-binding protein [Acidobacteria bacterium]|nr:ABC transporter ATP-binding protein [Acidobacteriota bacterium]